MGLLVDFCRLTISNIKGNKFLKVLFRGVVKPGTG